jgi:hypothetical protein
MFSGGCAQLPDKRQPLKPYPRIARTKRTANLRLKPEDGSSTSQDTQEALNMATMKILENDAGFEKTGDCSSYGLSFTVPARPLTPQNFGPEQIEEIYPVTRETFTKLRSNWFIGSAYGPVTLGSGGGVVETSESTVSFIAVLRNKARIYAETDGDALDALRVAITKTRTRQQFGGKGAPPVQAINYTPSETQNFIVTVGTIAALIGSIWAIVTIFSWKALLWIVAGIVVAFLSWVALFMLAALIFVPKPTPSGDQQSITQEIEETDDERERWELVEQAKHASQDER